MASIHRRPRSRFFVACFTDPSGRRRQVSTKTTDRKLALKLAAEFEELSAKRATEAQTRRTLSDLHEQIHGSPLDTATVETYAAQWLTRKTGETRGVTLSAYKSALAGFLSFLGEKKAQPIGYLTPAQISAWRDACAVKATATTANNKLKVIRAFLQTAWRDGLLPDGNAAAKVPSLRTEESTRRPLTIPEIRAALAVASKEWQGMILAGLYTGQRLKDLAGLTWTNIDLEKREIRLATSKTSRRQFLPIAAPLLAYLDKLDAGDDPRAPIFPTLHPHAMKAGGSAALSAQFHGVLAAAGLVTARSADKQSTGKGRTAPRAKTEISFHSLRHAATSLLKQAGVSESVAMDLIGHDSAAMSANYTHTDDRARRAAIDALPDVTKA